MRPTGATRRQSTTITIVVLGMAGLIYAVVQSAVLPALPSFQHSLHTSVGGASWILITYLLSASVATPIIGRLGDMYGKDRLLVLTLIGFAFGSALAAVANSIVVLDIARVIQGAGGGIVPLSFGIVRDELPRNRVPGTIGLVSSMLGIGGGVGIVLAGVILAHFSWHWLFWFPLIPTLLAAALAYFYVPPSPVRTPAKINWTAAALMTVGISAVLLGVSEASSWSWGSPKTLGVIAAGLLVCAAWVGWEVRSAVPLVDMRLMRLRPVWSINLAAVLLGGGMYALFVIIPELLQEPRSTGYGLGASVIRSGIFIVPLSVMMLVMSLQAGRVARRFGSKAALLAGTLATLAGFLLLVVAHDKPWHFYLATTIFGIGLGLAYSALGTLIVEAVPRTETGVASGMNAVMRTLGGAVGSAFAATFISSSIRHGQPLEHGYVLALAVNAGLVGLALLAGLLIPTRHEVSETAEVGLAAPVEASV